MKENALGRVWAEGEGADCLDREARALGEPFLGETGALVPPLQCRAEATGAPESLRVNPADVLDRARQFDLTIDGTNDLWVGELANLGYDGLASLSKFQL